VSTPPAFDFSVIVSTYNRPVPLSRCIESLYRLDYPKNRFEVIVIDDGGDVALDEVVDRYRDRLEIAMLHQRNAGPGKARNAGARAASGRYLVFTDDDCAPREDWLTVLASRLEDAPDAAVGGLTRNGLKENPYAGASQMLIDYLCDYFNSPRRGGAFATTSNLALPREAFLAMSGFDTRFRRAAGEDRDFIDRWHMTKKPFVYAPEVVVWHYHDLRFASFLRQHANYGRAALHFHHMRAARTDEAVRVEPPSFYLGLAAYPFAAESFAKAIALSALMTLTQVAHAFGFFREKLTDSIARK